MYANSLVITHRLLVHVQSYKTFTGYYFTIVDSPYLILLKWNQKKFSMWFHKIAIILLKQECHVIFRCCVDLARKKLLYCRKPYKYFHIIISFYNHQINYANLILQSHFNTSTHVTNLQLSHLWPQLTRLQQACDNLALPLYV